MALNVYTLNNLLKILTPELTECGVFPLSLLTRGGEA
jgi:hypothetical protein